jgi:hypothetical protein
MRPFKGGKSVKNDRRVNGLQRIDSSPSARAAQ